MLVVEFGRIGNRFRIVLGCNAVERVVSRHVRRVYTEVALEWNEQFHILKYLMGEIKQL